MALLNEKDNQQPLTSQGDEADEEMQESDTTNFSEDQLKNEDYPAEDNPDRIEDPDDLHEIRVDDDLDEPDTEKLHPSKDIDSFDDTLSEELDEDTP
jgi:hypothetical protein